MNLLWKMLQLAEFVDKGIRVSKILLELSLQGSTEHKRAGVLLLSRDSSSIQSWAMLLLPGHPAKPLTHSGQMPTHIKSPSSY